MPILDRDNDTICAISTASGYGAIAIVRLTGSDSCAIIRKSAPFLPKTLESHRVYYGYLKDISTGQDLDEVLVTYFEKGKSFTGEDVFEISCHGNPIISQSLLEVLVSSGARIAHRGEFTYRAFMSGRLDLTQAESILSLIESQTKLGTRMALRQLRGGLAKSVSEMKEKMIWCLSRLEANLDFSSEDIQIESDESILRKMIEVKQQSHELLSSFKVGRIAKDGYRVVLAGAPNVGKSSLLNALSGEDRAIVSEEPGTTRDTVESTIDLNGKKIEIVDTAGIRESGEKIELLGMERTKRNIATADLVLWVKDARKIYSEEILNWASETDAEVIVVYNKSDLISSDEIQCGKLFTSAKSQQGLNEIKKIIDAKTNMVNSEDQTQIMVVRQFELLKKVEESLSRGIDLMRDKMSPEFVIFELNESIQKVMELNGEQFDDEVLDRVFGDFCIGK